jgi:hypothetical protein
MHLKHLCAFSTVRRIKYALIAGVLFLILKASAQDLLTTIDFNDAMGSHAVNANATNGFFSNTLESTGFVTNGSGQAVWAYDATANGDPDLNDQFKIRTFTTPITEAAFSSVTFQFKIDFNLIDTVTRSAKLGFGFTSGSTKVAEARIAQIINGQARPEYIVDDSSVANFNPSVNGATNWGLTTDGNGVIIKTTVDFENDQVIMSYNNANNSDGDIVFATAAYTGSVVDGLRFSVAGNDLFTDGDGAFFAVDYLTISGVAVPEPSRIAYCMAVLSFGAVLLRRRLSRH